MLLVITVATRGAGGRAVVAVRRVRSGLVPMEVALICERAGSEVQSEEGEQHRKSDQPTQRLPVTAGPHIASHGQDSMAGTRVYRKSPDRVVPSHGVAG